MYIKKKFSFIDLFLWTRWEALAFVLIALIVTVLYESVGLRWLQLPWTPIALIGTAVAFYIGFQSNAAYERTWEARKIWGGIVNTSRTLGIMIKDTVTNEYAKNKAGEEEIYEIKRILTYRHIAWMTALRHALRQQKPWEVLNEYKTNKEWNDTIHIPERDISLEDDLKPFLDEEELKYVLTKTNKSTALLALQSKHIRSLKERGIIWEFSFLELEGIFKELFEQQGKSERIKNFPYPRQYATMSHYFVRVFAGLLPFGVVPEFAAIGIQLADSFPEVGRYFVWAAIPFSAIVSWVFHTMQRVGTVGENPFEGGVSDVPISTIARGIEIDLREMIDEDKSLIPGPIPTERNVQM